MDVTVKFELTKEERARIMTHVEIIDGHWLWVGYCAWNGYAMGYIGGKKRLVGRAILADKLGRKLLPEMQSCHIVGCRFRNCIAPDHLYEGTREQNMADKIADGTTNRGERHNMAKLTEAQIIAIRADDRKYKEIAAEYGIAQRTVSAIKLRKIWKHLP